jgi:hypothetical protein
MVIRADEPKATFPVIIDEGAHLRLERWIECHRLRKVTRLPVSLRCHGTPLARDVHLHGYVEFEHPAPIEPNQGGKCGRRESRSRSDALALGGSSGTGGGCGTCSAVR